MEEKLLYQYQESESYEEFMWRCDFLNIDYQTAKDFYIEENAKHE
jgi:hypothetical protein